MALTLPREALYDYVSSKIGGTPLRRIEQLKLAEGTEIYVKEEFRNPTGSHYDRQTIKLFHGREEEGAITPGKTTLLETTTGSSGASFAWLAKVLGYPVPTVVIPKDMPQARIAQIESYGAEIEFSQEGEYVSGLIAKAKRLVAKNRRVVPRDRKYFLNHSTDRKYSPLAMEDLGREIIQDLKNINRPPPDYLVVALGNGISALGLSKAFEGTRTKIIGVEPYESPTITKRMNPEEYMTIFGNGYYFTNHIMIGTGSGDGMEDKFPSLIEASKYLSGTLLPNKKQVLEMKDFLLYKELIHAGNSSAGCLWAANEIAQKHANEHPIIATIMYDAAWRYLDFRKEL